MATTGQKSSKAKNAEATGPARLGSRSIHRTVEAMLWGRAAGRCEFRGCNKPVSRSSVTRESINMAQKAHIYSFSENGSRGNEGVPAELINSVDNLILVCTECHLKIDHERNGGRYSVTVLQGMKAEHEERIARVTGIASDLKSHVLMYHANIDEQAPPDWDPEAAAAMFPERYPASDRALRLGWSNSATRDRDPEYWSTEERQLQTQFDRAVRSGVQTGYIRHLSVLALAPQPLLIRLGTLLGDIVPADVFQRHREPTTWSWPSKASTPAFRLESPTSFEGPPALVLALSGTISTDRIENVLGPHASIWKITVDHPHNDLTKSREQLGEFRKLIRSTLDQIKAKHGQTTTLHVFPALGAAMAVEAGRVRMPKADMPWQIYDQVSVLGGFVLALSLSSGDRS